MRKKERTLRKERFHGGPRPYRTSPGKGRSKGQTARLKPRREMTASHRTHTTGFRGVQRVRKQKRRGGRGGDRNMPCCKRSRVQKHVEKVFMDIRQEKPVAGEGTTRKVWKKLPLGRPERAISSSTDQGQKEEVQRGAEKKKGQLMNESGRGGSP